VFAGQDVHRVDPDCRNDPKLQVITTGGLVTVRVALVDIVAVGLDELVAVELVLIVPVPLAVELGLDEDVAKLVPRGRSP
jgi:hypothetical protein